LIYSSIYEKQEEIFLPNIFQKTKRRAKTSPERMVSKDVHEPKEVG
jgi:hypothetical protein